jgi:hypothetical protein
MSLVMVVDSGKYLGVSINKDLTWKKHINQTIGKASKTLGFLRRSLGRCTTFARNSDYNAFFRMETHLPFSLPFF